MSADDVTGENSKKLLSFNGLLDRFARESDGLIGSPTPPRPRTPSVDNDMESQITADATTSFSFSSPDTTPMKKKRKPARKYAPPSKYSHLSPISDSLAADLICIFVGINPGVKTAQEGHAFAGPNNLFWPLLFESGCVTRKLTFKEDRSLPAKWSLGITNLVSRPTAEQSELSKQEMIQSAASLEKRIREYQPELVCIVGKGIWDSVSRYKTGRPLDKAFTWGWQDENSFDFAVSAIKSDPHVENSSRWCPRVFVVPSTSGRVAAYSRSMKADLWKILGQSIQSIRERKSKIEI
ncbi:uracil-DNA glycosylase-like protein, partial [Lipomyces arxii]|uniref:uracil-DNA glycosylase-like protein n=1 Tax=Lipomyces arxii TaxID=56418 RepID=UPI0034CD07B7